MYYYADDMIKTMKHSPQLILFGAGHMAELAVFCLTREPYWFPISYCLVSEKEGNPIKIGTVPVIDYTDTEKLVQKDALILIATAEKPLDSIRQGLIQRGFSNLLPLTFENDLWSLLRGNIYRDFVLSQKKPYRTLEEELEKLTAAGQTEEKTVRVYTVRCHMDRELGEDLSPYSWETPIQAGAALTKQRVCKICDHTGEQISEKNRQYCELTALYWIWKNDRSDYVGFGHYRRHFELDEEQLRKLSRSDVDVVLTIPIMDIPDVETVYRRDHIGADWEVMLEAVGKLAPDYMDAVRAMGSGNFYYAYNMFLMRREILEDYCEWLFPILFYCEAHCGAKEDLYQNRYIGFLAEHLMSAYFVHHEKDYKIVHARKHFIM